MWKKAEDKISIPPIQIEYGWTSGFLVGTRGCKCMFLGSLNIGLFSDSFTWEYNWISTSSSKWVCFGNLQERCFEHQCYITLKIRCRINRTKVYVRPIVAVAVVDVNDDQFKTHLEVAKEYLNKQNSKFLTGHNVELDVITSRNNDSFAAMESGTVTFSIQ